MSNEKDKLNESYRGQVGLMIFALLLLLAGLAPIGLFGLLYSIFHISIGGADIGAVAFFLGICGLVGLGSIGAQNTLISKYTFWVLLGLGIANMSGCAMMLKGLSGIH